MVNDPSKRLATFTQQNSTDIPANSKISNGKNPKTTFLCLVCKTVFLTNDYKQLHKPCISYLYCILGAY